MESVLKLCSGNPIFPFGKRTFIRKETFMKGTRSSRTMALAVLVAALATVLIYSQFTTREVWQKLSSSHGYDLGYLDGYDRGQDDARRNVRSNFRTHDYDAADRGLDERVYSRNAYQEAYRKGYEAGYTDGYDNRSNQVAQRLEREASDRSPGRASSMPSRQASPDLREPPTDVRRGPIQRSTTTQPPAAAISVPEGTTLRIKLSRELSTKVNRRGDEFAAQVVQPVFIGADMVIPTGSTVKGMITSVERAGRLKGRSELNLRFDTLVLPNGRTETLVATLLGIPSDKEKEKVESGEGTVKGEGSKGRDAATIGTGAGIGAAIGAIAGGGKGTAVGGAVGAIAGTAGVLATRGKDIELPAGTELEIQLDRPLSLEAYAR